MDETIMTENLLEAEIQPQTGRQLKSNRQIYNTKEVQAESLLMCENGPVKAHTLFQMNLRQDLKIGDRC